MIRRVVGRLSYANVVATVALFVALGGGAYAVQAAKRNSVTSKSIKDNAVKSRDVKNGGLLARDFAADQLPQGEVGPKGPPGPKGVQGPPGPASEIAARPHNSGTFQSTADPGTPVPLSDGSWTQAADEVNVIVGSVDVEETGDCGSSVGALVTLYLDGEVFGIASANSTQQAFWSSDPIMNTGDEEEHTLTAKVWDLCTSHPSFEASDIRLAVLSYR